MKRKKKYGGKQQTAAKCGKNRVMAFRAVGKGNAIPRKKPYRPRRQG